MLGRYLKYYTTRTYTCTIRQRSICMFIIKFNPTDTHSPKPVWIKCYSSSSQYMIWPWGVLKHTHTRGSLICRCVLAPVMLTCDWKCSTNKLNGNAWYTHDHVHVQVLNMSSTVTLVLEQVLGHNWSSLFIVACHFLATTMLSPTSLVHNLALATKT